MPLELLGQFAAIATALCWSFGSILFTRAGREVGSPLVNRTRLVFALVFVMITHLVLEGSLLPLDAEPLRWGWMGISGLIGYVIGDALLFQGFVMIGPRLSMLMMATNPVFSLLLAWLILGETLEVRDLFGIALVLTGVIVVVMARDRDATRAADAGDLSPREYVVGVLFALGGAVGQASGAFFSKLGLVGDFAPISGNLIRLIAAASAIWLIAALRGTARGSVKTLRANPIAIRAIVAASVLGPFVGVTFSLIAIQNAPLGIATTLMGLTPVMLIPISRVLFNERIGPLAVLGTLVAFAGTAVLFL